MKLNRVDISFFFDIEIGALMLFQIRFLHRLVKVSFRFIDGQVDMSFRKIQSRWVDTVKDDSSMDLLIVDVRVQGPFKMVHVDIAQKNLHKFDNETIFQNFYNFSVDKSSWSNILFEL